MKFHVTYNPPDDTEDGKPVYSDKTRVGAFDLVKGEAVEMDGENHRTPWVLMNNPHFTVEEIVEEGAEPVENPKAPEFNEPGAV